MRRDRGKGRCRARSNLTDYKGTAGAKRLRVLAGGLPPQPTRSSPTLPCERQRQCRERVARIPEDVRSNNENVSNDPPMGLHNAAPNFFARCTAGPLNIARSATASMGHSAFAIRLSERQDSALPLPGPYIRGGESPSPSSAPQRRAEAEKYGIRQSPRRSAPPHRRQSPPDQRFVSYSAPFCGPVV